MYRIGNLFIFLAASPMVAAFWVPGAISLQGLVTEPPGAGVVFRRSGGDANHVCAAAPESSWTSPRQPRMRCFMPLRASLSWVSLPP